MRIGLVLSTTPGYSETFFHSKIRGLQKNGIEVHLFCYNKKKDFNLCPVVEGAKVPNNAILMGWYFTKEYILLLPYLSTVARYVKLERKEGTGWVTLFKRIYLNAHFLKSKVDWLHFGFATLAVGRETVAKAIGAKMAVSFRGFDIAVYPIKNRGCYSILWKYVDKIHTNSDRLRTLALKLGLCELSPYMKITPAIDVELFRSFKDKIIEVDKPIFMTTGRLHYIKGFVSTIEALALLKDQGLDFTYNIVGDGEEYERIAFAAHQLGLKENVHFLGKLPQLEVKQELEKADIYIQYSVHEGFCNAVLEAQAMGKLTIVSNGGGFSENVIDGQTGWIVLKQSPKKLAEQIMKVVLMDEKTKIKISQNAVERVEKEFILEKQKREFLEFYEVSFEFEV